jgi:peptide/nickel transport system substrate-binding protein
MRVSSSRRNMYIAIVVIVIIVVAGVGVGLYMTRPTTPTVQNPGKIIVDEIGQPIPGVDPATDYETSGGEIIQNCYEALLFYNYSSSSQLNYVLCQNYTESTDGLTYTFNLRQGITFQDGSQFNASAMKWSLDRAILINDPTGPSWILSQFVKGAYTYYTFNQALGTAAIYKAALAYLEAGGIQVTSQYQLVIHVDYHDNSTATPFPAVPYCLAMTVAMAVSPTYVFKHDTLEGNAADTSTTNNTMSVAQYNHTFLSGPAVSSVPFTDGRGIIPDYYGAPLYAADSLNGATCGTGPYNMTSWVSGVGETLEYNPNYWGGPHNTGVASVHEIVLNFVTSFDTMKLALLAGTADVVEWDPSYSNQIINLTTRTVLPQYASDITVYTNVRTLVVDQLEFAEFPYMPNTGVVLCTSVNNTLAGHGNTTIHDQVVNSTLNPFQYPDFRLAFVNSYNFTAFYSISQGDMAPLNGFIPSGMYAYNSSIPSQNTYANFTLAEQLFNKVGWNGTVNVYFNTGNIIREDACLMEAAQVAAASQGRVSVNVVELTWTAFLELEYSKGLPVGDVGWLPDYPRPDDYAFPYAMPLGTFAYFIGLVIPGKLQNDTIEAATTLNATLSEILYSRVITYMNAQGDYLWTGQPLEFAVMRSWIHGYFYNPLFSGLMYYDLTKS